MPLGDLARQDDLGGFDYTVDPDLAKYPPDYNASNYSVQPPYRREPAMPDARWAIGALAAQNAYQPAGEGAFLADVGAPAIPSGGQFSPGLPAVNAHLQMMYDKDRETLDNVGHGIYDAASELATLPKRAIGAAQSYADTGVYNPAPAVEAALNVMGAGGLVGAPVKAGEVLAGAGPIRAYHSSPHDFDRFDLSKIGTGEGAQAYGHGLYFAESPAVSGQGGQYWNQFSKRFGGPEGTAATYLQATKFDREKAAEMMRKSISGFEQDMANLASSDKYGELSDYRALHGDRLKTLQLLESGKPVGPRTYEVNINADPAHFLDWDKPLGQQPHIVDALKQQGYKDAPWPYSGRLIPGGPNGVMVDLEGGAQDAYRALGTARKDGYTQYNYPAATQALNEAGIPGIKYLDEGSRGATNIPQLEAAISGLQQKLQMMTPSQRSMMADTHNASLMRWQAELEHAKANPPTSNYVVFNPDIIDILKKYGIAGAAPVGLGALAAQGDYQPEERN